MSIRVPKTFVLFERFVFKKICVHLCHLWENKIIIRVQKKQSAQVPHTNTEPRRTTFILFNICHISFAYEKRTVLFQNLLTVLYYHSSMSASTYGTTGKVIFLAVHSLRCTYRRYAGLHVIGNLAILKYKRTILIT